MRFGAVDSEGLSEQARVFALEEELAATRARQVLSLLALLVQKYKC